MQADALAHLLPQLARQKRGDIARAGGAPYLHTLISSVPTAANASYYAKIVREHAIMRRLVEAGTKIVQLGYNVEGEVDDAVDQAQAEVYAVTERRTSEDYVQLATLLPEALDEIDEGSEYRSAFDLAFKKYNTMSRLEPDVQVRRIQSLLQRKGFGFGVISQVLKELDILSN